MLEEPQKCVHAYWVLDSSAKWEVILIIRLCYDLSSQSPTSRPFSLSLCNWLDRQVVVMFLLLRSLPPSSPFLTVCLFVFLIFLCPLTLTSCCSSSLPRVTIDPAKRQTAKTGPAIPSTQGGKTLSKSSALRSLSASSYLPPFSPFLPSFSSSFFSSVITPCI